MLPSMSETAGSNVYIVSFLNSENVMLKVTVQSVGDALIIRCRGRIVAGTAEQLQHVVQGSPSCELIVLDLAEVTRMDAAGLGVLASLHGLLEERGARLKLLNVACRVERLLRLTRLNAVLEVCSVPEIIALMCRAHAAAAAERQASAISA